MENIFEKGGKTKVKYDYIPQKAIDELSYTINKVTKGISGDKLLSGVYVKSDVKSKTKSGSNLTAKILGMTDDEDKKEVILEKDVKEFQKYISDKLITAFYLGLPEAYDFKGDYSYGGGIITMRVDDAKRMTKEAIKNAKNKKFEMGLKYPQYDFEKLLGKPIIKDVFGKLMTLNGGLTEKYKYRLWIWKDCVIGQTIGSDRSSRGYTDYTYGEEPTLMGGYKSIQTSKASKLESIINFMAKDKDGFVKDNNVLFNGLGGANFETLDSNKIKYAKGGAMEDSIMTVFLFGLEKDANDFFEMADKFTDYDVLRLSPFAIQYNGGKEGFDFLYDRAENYESNLLDIYAKGGGVEDGGKQNITHTQLRNMLKDLGYKVSFKRNSLGVFAIVKDLEGKELPTIFMDEQHRGKWLPVIEIKNKYSILKDNEKVFFAKGGKVKRSKHSLMQDRRRVSSEPWEVAYQKRKAKMEAGGTLPTPFGQAGLVGETGAMNEMDLFAMGGGLPQGVHQYYANTYNPAYPTPHGYAKGGEVVGLHISRLHSDFPKGFENSGEVIKKGNNKFKVENGILLIKMGSSDWKEWRKITYAKGGEIEYKTGITKYGKNQYAVRVDIGDKNLIPKLLNDRWDSKSEAEAFAKRLAKRNNGTYVGEDGMFAKGGKITLKTFANSQPSTQEIEGIKVYNTYSERFGYINDDLSSGLPSKVFVSKNKNSQSGKYADVDDLIVVNEDFAKGGEIVVKGIDKNGGEFYREFDSYEDALEEISQPHFNHLDRDSIRYYDEDDKLVFAKGGKTQGYNDRLDESLSNLNGAERMMKQSYKDRRDESKGMEKSMGNRPYSSVGTMDKMANGGEINKRFLDNQTSSYRDRIFQSIADYYGTTKSKIQRELFDKDAEMIYEYIGNNRGLKMRVYEDMEKQSFAKGGMTTSDKHAKIIADLKKIKSDVTDRPPKVYERDGLLLVSSEEGDEFSDYYGTFYEPMYVDKRLEAIADKYDGYWVWQDAGTIGFVDDLTTISDTIGGGRNFAKGGMMQGYNDRLDESLGMRDGAERMMKQSYRDRRDESKGMEKSMGRRAYQSVGTMDKMANGGQIKERRRLQNKKSKESAKLFKVGDSVELKPEYHNLGSIRKGKVLRVYKDDGDLKVKDDNQKRVDVLFPANYFSKTSFAKGGKIGFDGLAKKVAKRYEGKPVKEKFRSEYGKTYSKAEAMEVGKKVAGKVYRQQQSMAKGGKIQMSEVYNVNGKDYLFSTPIQNDKGTYTGWDAYEVVYDTFDGEKHLNYTKTKRGKSKYFPNGVKRTEAEDYFAKGGATSVDTSDVVFFAYEEMMKKNKKFKSEEELYDFVNEGYAFPKYSKKAVKTAFKSLSEDFYAKGGKTQGYNDKLNESLGNTKGKRSTKEQNYKDSGDESKAMEKSMGRRAYQSVGTMDKMAKGGKVKNTELKYINSYSRFSEILKGKLDNRIFYSKVTPKDIEKAYDIFKSTSLTVVQSINKVLREKTKLAKGGKTQGYNDKLDESLGNTKGKRSTKEQNYKDRRNESEAMEKKGGKRKYASVKTMDKGNRSKRKTPMSLAKEIRKEGEKWQDAVKRASAIIKKEAK